VVRSTCGSTTDTHATLGLMVAHKLGLVDPGRQCGIPRAGSSCAAALDSADADVAMGTTLPSASQRFSAGVSTAWQRGGSELSASWGGASSPLRTSSREVVSPRYPAEPADLGPPTPDLAQPDVAVPARHRALGGNISNRLLRYPWYRELSHGDDSATSRVAAQLSVMLGYPRRAPTATPGSWATRASAA
jgi:hypothetical protein